ncbi:hypothetical protein K9M06_01600 [Candidatus Bipolaricaulota bacterium]|nr:hypothetical protein [Candidatus Bipolaricaulota bacterium]
MHNTYSNQEPTSLRHPFEHASRKFLGPASPEVKNGTNERVEPCPLGLDVQLRLKRIFLNGQ